jgi:hypothetical protein
MNKMKKTNYLPVLWFFLGFGLFMFTRSTMFVPIACGFAHIVGFCIKCEYRPVGTS